VLGDLLAVARGLSSTWAGLAPAVGPPSTASDPLEGRHRWLAVIPSAASAQPRPSIEPGTATVTDTGTSLVVQTQPLTLVEARAAVAPLILPGADATLYPIDG
jgi:hypothetical protein